METQVTTKARADLYRRLKASDKAAKKDAERSLRSSTERGAIVDALVKDGASLREIARELGISHSAVDKILTRYHKAMSRA